MCVLYTLHKISKVFLLFGKRKPIDLFPYICYNIIYMSIEKEEKT